MRTSRTTSQNAPTTRTLYRLTPTTVADLTRSNRQVAIVAAANETDARIMAKRADPFAQDWTDERLFASDARDTGEDHVIGDVTSTSSPVKPPVGKKLPNERHPQGELSAASIRLLCCPQEQESQMAKKAKKSKKSAPKKGAKKATKKTTKAASKKTGSKKKSSRAASQPWSDNEVERLKKLITQNTPTPLIASKLKRSLVSVRGYVQRNGLSLRPVNRSPAD